MMASLFSIFESSSGLMDLELNWLSTFIGLMFFPYMYWVSPSRWSIALHKLNMALHQEFKNILGPSQQHGTIVFVSLFSFIVFNNFVGLLPYVFTSSSHLVMTLRLALPLWLTFTIYGWVKHTWHMFAHLVPQGTPAALMPFMMLIESISNVIRPGTLAVRLMANMMAGHLLLTLLGGTGPSLTSYLLVLLFIVADMLLIFMCNIQNLKYSHISTMLNNQWIEFVNNSL